MRDENEYDRHDGGAARWPPFAWEKEGGKEPTQRRLFLPVVLLLLLLGSPQSLPPAWRGELVFGLPAWTAMSMLGAASLAAFTAYAALRWWRDPSEGELDDE